MYHPVETPDDFVPTNAWCADRDSSSSRCHPRSDSAVIRNSTGSGRGKFNIDTSNPRRNYRRGAGDVLFGAPLSTFNNYGSITSSQKQTTAVKSGGVRFWNRIPRFSLPTRKGNKQSVDASCVATHSGSTTGDRTAITAASYMNGGDSAYGSNAKNYDISTNDWPASSASTTPPRHTSATEPPSFSQPQSLAVQAEKVEEPDISQHPAFRREHSSEQEEGNSAISLLTLANLSSFSFHPEVFRGSMFLPSDGTDARQQESLDDDGARIESAATSPEESDRDKLIRVEEQQDITNFGTEEGSKESDDDGSVDSWELEEAQACARRAKEELKRMLQRRERNKRRKASKRKELIMTPEGNVEMENPLEQRDQLQQQWLEREHARKNQDIQQQENDRHRTSVDSREGVARDGRSERPCECHAEQDQKQSQQSHPPPSCLPPLLTISDSVIQDANKDLAGKPAPITLSTGPSFIHANSEIQTSAPHLDRTSTTPKWQWEGEGAMVRGIHDGVAGVTDRCQSLPGPVPQIANSCIEMRATFQYPRISYGNQLERQPGRPAKLQKQPKKSALESKRKPQTRKEYEDELRQKERHAVQSLFAYAESLLRDEGEHYHEMDCHQTRGQIVLSADEEQDKPRRSVSLRRRLGWKKLNADDRQRCGEKESGERVAMGGVSRSSSFKRMVFGRKKDEHQSCHLEQGESYPERVDRIERSPSFRDRKKRNSSSTQAQSRQNDGDVLNAEEEMLTRLESFDRAVSNAAKGVRKFQNQEGRDLHDFQIAHQSLRQARNDLLSTQYQEEGLSSQPGQQPPIFRILGPHNTAQDGNWDIIEEGRPLPLGDPSSNLFYRFPQSLPRHPFVSRIPQRLDHPEIRAYPAIYSPRSTSYRPYLETATAISTAPITSPTQGSQISSEVWHHRSLPGPTKQPTELEDPFATFSMYLGGERYANEELRQQSDIGLYQDESQSSLCPIPEDEGEASAFEINENYGHGDDNYQIYSAERRIEPCAEHKDNRCANTDTGECDERGGEDNQPKVGNTFGGLESLKRENSQVPLMESGRSDSGNSKAVPHERNLVFIMPKNNLSDLVSKGPSAATSRYSAQVGNESDHISRNSSSTIETVCTSSTDLTVVTSSSTDQSNSGSQAAIDVAGALTCLEDEAFAKLRRARVRLASNNMLSTDTEPGSGQARPKTERRASFST